MKNRKIRIISKRIASKCEKCDKNGVNIHDGSPTQYRGSYNVFPEKHLGTLQSNIHGLITNIKLRNFGSF